MDHSVALITCFTGIAAAQQVNHGFYVIYSISLRNAVLRGSSLGPQLWVLPVMCERRCGNCASRTRGHQISPNIPEA